MSNDIQEALDLSVEIGKLKGAKELLSDMVATLNGRLDGMQDDLDLMRERSVRAETELAVLQKTFEQIERIKL